jgi:hypothetical protein
MVTMKLDVTRDIRRYDRQVDRHSGLLDATPNRVICARLAQTP